MAGAYWRLVHNRPAELPPFREALQHPDKTRTKIEIQIATAQLNDISQHMEWNIQFVIDRADHACGWLTAD
jgi:hypothetical protein